MNLENIESGFVLEFPFQSKDVSTCLNKIKTPTAFWPYAKYIFENSLHLTWA